MLRIPHTYIVGDKILLKRGTEKKYETPYQGPFTIIQVNENGTVQMMIKNVEDTINIRRPTPCLGTDDIPHGGKCSMQNSRVRRANQDRILYHQVIICRESQRISRALRRRYVY
jgi:hypothetical protein